MHRTEVVKPSSQHRSAAAAGDRLVAIKGGDTRTRSLTCALAKSCLCCRHRSTPASQASATPSPSSSMAMPSRCCAKSTSTASGSRWPCSKRCAHANMPVSHTTRRHPLFAARAAGTLATWHSRSASFHFRGAAVDHPTCGPSKASIGRAAGPCKIATWCSRPWRDRIRRPARHCSWTCLACSAACAAAPPPHCSCYTAHRAYAPLATTRPMCQSWVDISM